MKYRARPDKPAPPAACAARRGTRLHSLPREGLRVLLLYGLSAVMLCWIFPPNPVPLWPLAFVCLVPWTVATCRTQRAWLVHWLSFFVGWGFFLVSLRWLMPVTGLGYAALGAVPGDVLDSGGLGDPNRAAARHITDVDPAGRVGRVRVRAGHRNDRVPLAVHRTRSLCAASLDPDQRPDRSLRRHVRRGTVQRCSGRVGTAPLAGSRPADIQATVSDRASR